MLAAVTNDHNKGPDQYRDNQHLVHACYVFVEADFVMKRKTLKIVK